MATTPNYSLRYPVVADTPNVPRDIKNLADDVDARMTTYDLSGISGDIAGLDSRLDVLESGVGATLQKWGGYQSNSVSCPDGQWTTLNCMTQDNAQTYQGSWHADAGSGYHRLTSAGIYVIAFRARFNNARDLNFELWDRIAGEPLQASTIHSADYVAGSVGPLLLAANIEIAFAVKPWSTTSSVGGSAKTYLRFIKLQGA